MFAFFYLPGLATLVLIGLYQLLRLFPQTARDIWAPARYRNQTRVLLGCYLLLLAGIMLRYLLVGGAGPVFAVAVLLAAPLAYRHQVPTWMFGCGLLVLMGGIYQGPIRGAFFPPPEPAYRPVRVSMKPTISDLLQYEENAERVARYAPDAPAVSSAAGSDRVPPLTEIEQPLSAPPAPEDYVLLKIDYDAAFTNSYVLQPRRMKPQHRLVGVHELWLHRFTQTMGFGVGRRRPYVPEDAPDLHPVPSSPDGRGPLPDEYTPADQFEMAVRAANSLPIEWDRAYSPGRDDVDAHLRSNLSFTLWMVKHLPANGRNARTFSSHFFGDLPVVVDRETKQLDEWRITQLDLVSLLKHETPRVYVDRLLPNTARLRSDTVPTRDLDPFEHKSLRFLREGYDVVIDEQHDQIRMFGSLRAAQQCLNCHSVPQDTLLGAFTYELRKPAVSVSVR